MVITPLFISTVTAKGQATIPIEVRKVLDVRSGDKVRFEVKNGKVTVSKLTPFDLAYHEALSSTLIEWASPEDEEAYNDL